MTLLEKKVGSYAYPLLQFSPTGQYTLVLSADGRLGIWDGRMARQLREVEALLDQKQAERGALLNAQFGANEEYLFTTATTFSPSGRIDKIEVNSGRIAATWRVPDPEPRVLTLHPTEPMIAIGGSSRAIYLLDTTSGRELARWQAHDAPLSAPAFSPDGKTLVSGGRDGTLKLWDIPSIRKELSALNMGW
jgi:WD40 repeat protein